VTNTESSVDTEIAKFTINDFAKLMNVEDDSSINLVNTTVAIGSSVTNCLQSVTKGLKSWEYKFIASYALIPSVLCHVLPIVQIIGQSGCGKSQLLIAISHLTKYQIISGQSTGASLKNHINVIRWVDPESKKKEKNCLLLIDNLKEDCFKKEEYLSSFLNGYNRLTDRTYISNGRGENIEFRTFSGKIYTTIWENTSTELKRRTISIKGNKTDKLSEILDVEDIKWSLFRKKKINFWEDEDNWTTFAKNRKLFLEHQKPGGSKELWLLLRDVMATGLTVGVWDTIESCVDETFEWLTYSLKPRQSLLEALLVLA